MLRDVHIVLNTNKTYSKRRDYLFSFNLNLDLFTLALENFLFNTLDIEKVQGKSLCCIFVHPCYREPPQRDERETHAAREPRVADPTPALCRSPNTNLKHSKILNTLALVHCQN